MDLGESSNETSFKQFLDTQTPHSSQVAYPKVIFKSNLHNTSEGKTFLLVLPDLDIVHNHVSPPLKTVDVKHILMIGCPTQDQSVRCWFYKQFVDVKIPQSAAVPTSSQSWLHRQNKSWWNPVTGFPTLFLPGMKSNLCRLWIRSTLWKCAPRHKQKWRFFAAN